MMLSWRWRTLLLAYTVLETACSPGPQGVPDEALHVELVCGASGEEIGWGCTTEERRQALATWAQRDLPPGGSTFTVWGLGARPDAHMRLLAACVPATWGTNPQRGRRWFLEQVRRTLAS